MLHLSLYFMCLKLFWWGTEKVLLDSSEGLFPNKRCLSADSDVTPVGHGLSLKITARVDDCYH